MMIFLSICFQEKCFAGSPAGVTPTFVPPVASKSDLELKESVLKKSLRGFYNQMFSD